MPLQESRGWRGSSCRHRGDRRPADATDQAPTAREHQAVRHSRFPETVKLAQDLNQSRLEDLIACRWVLREQLLNFHQRISVPCNGLQGTEKRDPNLKPLIIFKEKSTETRMCSFSKFTSENLSETPPSSLGTVAGRNKSRRVGGGSVRLTDLLTKATAGAAFSVTGRQSPAEGERPTAGSDESNPSPEMVNTSWIHPNHS